MTLVCKYTCRYESVPDRGSDRWRLGPLLIFDVEGVIVGLLSAVAAYPIALFVAFFFRNSRKSALRENRTNAALSDEDEQSGSVFFHVVIP